MCWVQAIVLMTSVDLCDLRTFLLRQQACLGVDECVGNQQPIKCPQLCPSFPVPLPINHGYPGQRYTEAILVRVVGRIMQLPRLGCIACIILLLCIQIRY